MKVYHLIIFPLLLLVLSACGVTDSDGSLDVQPIDFTNYEQNLNALPGSWDWQYTADFSNAEAQPFVQTPASTGTNRRLEITNSNIIEFYIDGDLENTIPAQEYLTNQQWGGLGDTLAISATHLGGPEAVYIRGN